MLAFHEFYSISNDELAVQSVSEFGNKSCLTRLRQSYATTSKTYNIKQCQLKLGKQAAQINSHLNNRVCKISQSENAECAYMLADLI